MFNLEQAILEWRRQMLAAGVKTPVPLDELETHLRDEIEQRTNSGLSEAEALQTAIQKMGQAGLLKAEFAKTSGFLDWFGDNRSTRINHVLGALWFAQCLWFLISMLVPLTQLLKILFNFQSIALGSGFVILFVFIIIYGAGLRGSIDLFRGAASGRRLIRFLAILRLVAFVVQILRFESVSVFGYILTIFNLISIWLLRSPSVKNPNAAAG
jgi:hypothetical protein